MAENKVSIEISLEEQDALRSLNSLSKKLKEVGETGEKSFSGLGSTLEKALKVETAADFFALGNTVVAAAKGVKALAEELFNLALKAEDIKAIGIQFDLLASRSGLIGDELARGLIKAADGVAQTDDILRAASQSLVALGSNGERLPEVFELARKAASVFGGDAIQRFNEVSNAIETGNVKGLKQLGIIINTDAVYKEFAKTLGLTAEQLTTNEKQQALLNAVLDKGGKSFEGVDVNVRELENNSKKLSVALSELGDSSALAFNRAFGPSISNGTKELTLAVESLGRGLRVLAGEAISSDEKIKVLSTDYDRLIKLREAQGNVRDPVLDSQIELLQRKIQLEERSQQIAQGGNGDGPANLDTGFIKSQQRTSAALEEAAAARKQIQATEDQEAIARNAAKLESERNLQAEISIIQTNAALEAGEREVLLRDAQTTNQLQELETLQAFEQAKLDQKFAAETQKALLIADSTKREQELSKISAQQNLANEQLKTKQELDESRKRKAFRDANNANTLAATQNFLSAGINLAKEGSAEQKALQSASALVSTYTAANQALSAPPGPPFTLPLVASVIALGLSNLAKINSVKFAQGGIVPGSSNSGDRISASLNSGEMVLNKQQQAELFNMANGGGGGSDLIGAINSLGDRISRMNIVVQANGRELARLVRDERESGFAV